MYLSKVTIKGFRQFDSNGIDVKLLPGLTALVGPNDSGKTAIIDAIRYALSTTDHEYISVHDDDFHIGEDGITVDEFSVLCRFDGLSQAQRAAFLEYLTMRSDETDPVLYICYKAIRNKKDGRRKWNSTTIRCGLTGDGPAISAEARELLAAAYLRPLRDAERELSPGRRSRLSQVLQGFSGIENGEPFDERNPPSDLEQTKELSLEGLVAYLHSLVNEHSAIEGAKTSINEDYLSHLSLVGDKLAAEISFVSGATSEARLRHMLERLELNLLNANSEQRGRYGLGSLNLLYMACELLLTEKESEGSPLLLIEEPEAHLHPQRQLQLSRFLEQQASKTTSPIQVIVSTHSPVLASKIMVENLILVTKEGVRSLRQGNTALSASDYGFLHRFLDVTKANLFFARGIILVEGNAEQILLPTLAKLLGKDLTEAGVSIVNVGSTAHARYARIFQSSTHDDDTLPFNPAPPVAVVRDRDIMPHIAATMLGRVEDGNDKKWSNASRKWITDQDPKFLENMQSGETNEMCFERNIDALVEKYSALNGESVRVFVSDSWTLEYDLAKAGLAKEVYVAAQMAKNDDRLSTSTQAERATETNRAKKAFDKLAELFSEEALYIKVYQEFDKRGTSKAIAAQYLAELLESEYGCVGQDRKLEKLRANLPSYLVSAIDYVTSGAATDAAQ